MSSNDIWSDSPRHRLQAVRKHQGYANRISRKLARNTPLGHWPYGMPTSVNPWLMVFGISPGRGEHSDDSSYPPPTVGNVHSGFGGNFSNPNKPWDGPYWKKVRQLCVGIIQKIEPKIESPEERLSLCGHLNLGVRNQGRGTFSATNKKIINWIPTAIETLKPRVIILFGWKSLLGNLRERWDSSHPIGFLVNSSPQLTIPLRCDSQRTYYYSIWELDSKWGKIIAVCWPNHPSKHPFNKEKNWDLAINQASHLIAKALK